MEKGLSATALTMVCLYLGCGINKVEQSLEEFLQVECKSYTRGNIGAGQRSVLWYIKFPSSCAAVHSHAQYIG